jgi:uncharacterized metal-binding protein
MSDSENMRRDGLSCVDCGNYKCGRYAGEYPDFCLTANMEPGVLEKSLDLLMEPENNALAVASAVNEYKNYGRRTRVEEIMIVAKGIGAKKLGIATCVGLMEESKALARLLRLHGFEVYGVACKVGAVEKSRIGVPAECETLGRSMCNPVLQALLLNRAGTELNIVVGLCVGHDSLFYKYAEAFTTTLIAKDRVTGHNPAAVLYNLNSYYRRLKQPDPKLDFDAVEEF